MRSEHDQAIFVYAFYPASTNSQYEKRQIRPVPRACATKMNKSKSRTCGTVKSLVVTPANQLKAPTSISMALNCKDTS